MLNSTRTPELIYIFTHYLVVFFRKSLSFCVFDNYFYFFSSSFSEDSKQLIDIIPSSTIAIPTVLSRPAPLLTAASAISFWCSHKSVAFRESIVAVFGLGVLGHGLVHRGLDIDAVEGAADIAFSWQSQLLLQLLEHLKISLSLVCGPGPWLLLLLFEVLDLPECALDVHDVGGDAVEVAVVGVVVRRVNVVVIFAVPSNIV